MTKKIFAVMLAVLMLLNMAACGNNDENVPDGCIKISEDGVGYSFYMVKEWIPLEKSGMTSAKVSDFDTSNVSMMGFDPGEARSDVEYWDIYSDELKASFRDIAFEEEETETNLGGKSAKQYIYTVNVSGKEYKIMQRICYMSNTKAFTSKPEVYVFTYTAFADKYDDNIEDALYMAENVKFD